MGVNVSWGELSGTSGGFGSVQLQAVLMFIK